MINFRIVPILVYLSQLFIFCAANSQSPGRPNGKIVGKLYDPSLNEVSGIACSVKHKDIFYVHNDSGDGSRFFALAANGKLITTYYFYGREHERLNVTDCEDIAVGPGPIHGKSYIYLADIGDNLGWRSQVRIFRFEEPVFKKRKADTLQADVLYIKYPDGPRDAETIMIDPGEKMIYIVSKREDSVGIYHTPLLFNNNDKATLMLTGKLFFGGRNGSNWIVSGDISRDGNKVLLKSVSGVYYWELNGREPVYRTLLGFPKKQPGYKSHGQEEAITFSKDGNGYYITAEGRGSNIYYYRLEK